MQQVEDRYGVTWNLVGNLYWAMVSYETTGHECLDFANCLMCEAPATRDRLHIHVRDMRVSYDHGLCSEACLIWYLNERGLYSNG